MDQNFSNAFMNAYTTAVILGALWVGAFVGIIIGGISGYMASTRGERAVIWFLYGFIMSLLGGLIFGILGAMLSGCIPVFHVLLKKKQGEMQCPACKEWIKEDASVCKHCHIVIADWSKNNSDNTMNNSK